MPDHFNEQIDARTGTTSEQRKAALDAVCERHRAEIAAQPTPGEKSLDVAIKRFVNSRRVVPEGQGFFPKATPALAKLVAKEFTKRRQAADKKTRRASAKRKPSTRPTRRPRK